jgi:hypothetical protein
VKEFRYKLSSGRCVVVSEFCGIGTGYCWKLFPSYELSFGKYKIRENKVTKKDGFESSAFCAGIVARNQMVILRKGGLS